MHCCPKDWAAEFGTEPYETDPLPIVTADGTEVCKYGYRRIPCQLESGGVYVICFEVLGIRRPIVAVNKLNTDGMNVLFLAVGAGACHEEACMWNKNFVASFVQIGSLKYLPVHLPIVVPVVASLTCKNGEKIPEGAQWLLVEWCGTERSELAA